MSDLVGFDDLQPGDIFIDHAGKVFTVTERYGDTFWYTDGILPMGAAVSGNHFAQTRGDWPYGKVQLRLYRADVVQPKGTEPAHPRVPKVVLPSTLTNIARDGSGR